MAGDNPRGTVAAGEVVEWPHGVHDHRIGVVGQRIDAFVSVQHLGLLARADLDADGCAQLVVPENAVEHSQDKRIDRGPVEAPSLFEQRIDPTGGKAFESVAPRRSVGQDP